MGNILTIDAKMISRIIKVILVKCLSHSDTKMISRIIKVILVKCLSHSVSSFFKYERTAAIRERFTRSGALLCGE